MALTEEYSVAVVGSAGVAGADYGSLSVTGTKYDLVPAGTGLLGAESVPLCTGSG